MSAHWYSLTGDLVDPWTPGAYPSVSTILDRVRSDAYEALVGRMGQEAADELMSTAAARGTRVHKACEVWILTESRDGAIAHAELEPGEEAYLDGFIRWAQEHAYEFLASEKSVRSEKYKYSGRLDLVTELVDGTVWLIDIKTGVDSVRHGLQLKLYQQAYYEMTGIRARMGVLSLDAKRQAGYRHSRSPYGLKEYRTAWAPCEAHIKVFKWWNKQNPARAPKEVPVWEPNFEVFA